MKYRKKTSIEDDGKNLLEIRRTHPPVPAALDRVILAQASVCRRQAKRNFFVRHVVQYAALAAAVCICCLAPFYFAERPSVEHLTTPRTSAVQWDWKSYGSLDELNLDIENISSTVKNGTVASYYGSELTLEAVMEGINSYEVIL
jgi:hypothetical protein